MFGVTVKSRLGQLVLYSLGVLLLGVVLSARWGLGAWVVPALLLALAVTTARQVSVARDEVWRAACLELDSPRQRPEALGERLVPATAATLARLAEAVDLVRRGRYVEANELVPRVDRDLLRNEEAQLLEAVRAMISMGIGSTSRAAQQAVAALPTGSEELDVCLGRTVVSDAWQDPARLGAIYAAWERAGVAAGPLLRLKQLVRLRIDAELLDSVPAPEARLLSDEARAIGDDELAAELDARSRPTAYR